MKRYTLAEIEELRNREPGFLKTREVQALLGVSHVTVGRMRDDGQISYVKCGDGYRYPLEDVLALVQNKGDEIDWL